MVYYFRKKAVENVQKTGRICILDVELQGVRSIKQCDLNAKYILIKAPNLEVLVSSIYVSFLFLFIPCEAVRKQLGLG